jgi:membrane-associated phospholipid phosphatase
MRRTVLSLSLFALMQLAVLLAPADTARAQTTPTPSPTPVARGTPSLERDFFKNVLHDQKAIWTAPLHLQRSDAEWMIPSGIGLMALFTSDRITGDSIGQRHGQIQTSKVLSYPGSVYGVGATAATFYLVGRKTNDARARETGVLSAEAVVDSLLLVQALKAATQRARPHAGRDRSEFFDGGDSFPSGHSIQAWSVATVVANEYHEHRLAQIAAYGIASAVSVARFTGGKHYISDALVGSVLGFGIGNYVYHAHHVKNSDSADDQAAPVTSRWPAITPHYDRRARHYGVALAWSF